MICLKTDSVCMFYAFESKHSNCGHFRAGPITYSESVWPEGLSLAIHFPEKWPVANLPKEWPRHSDFLICPVLYDGGSV
jgi:hypothetical protein